MRESKILFIDLTKKEIRKDTIINLSLRNRIGGVSAAWEMLSKFLKPGVDPFSSDNPLIISVGSLVGTSAPGAAKVTCISKYPIFAEDKKHFVGSSVSGGRDFGLMLKNAGYDHLVITGKSDEPVFISIENDDISINSAKHLWGQGVEKTTELLKDKYGSECGCLVIGPAGENLVRFAMATIDLTNSLGRSGLGAVIGSKKLKAIVVKGNKGIRIADEKRFDNNVKKIEELVNKWENLPTWRRLGMGGGWSTFRFTQYPGKWTQEKWDRLYGEETRKQTLEKVVGCTSCRMACRIKWRIDDGEFKNEIGMGSPYGKSATSGLLLNVEEHRKMIHLVGLANAAGLDFYTFARITDWVSTLFEEGVITKEDTLGLDLTRKYENYVKLFEQIVNKEGFGSLIAEGWNVVGEELNIDPQEYWYAGVCKGVDFIYDARAAKLHPLMMTFFTNPRPHHGGCHTITTGIGKDIESIRAQLETWQIPEDNLERIFKPTEHSGRLNVGRYTKWMEDAMMVRNSLGVCSMYSAFGMENMTWLAELYSAVTGDEISARELMTEGERAFTYKKMANVREGFTRKDDRVPELWLRPMDTPEGKQETTDYYNEKVLTKDDFEKILDDYYDEREWDVETGIPTKEKLEKLNIKY